MVADVVGSAGFVLGDITVGSEALRHQHQPHHPYPWLGSLRRKKVNDVTPDNR